MKDEICRQIESKKADIFALSTACGKGENNIAKILYKILDWKFEKLNYHGLFGWEKFMTDKHTKFNDGIVIFEIKKVIEGSEYGYWHALSQALLYEFLERDSRDFLILCIVFDWGRKANENLNDHEKEFLNQFRTQKIFFVRISMGSSPSIEHNLKDEWIVIR